MIKNAVIMSAYQNAHLFKIIACVICFWFFTLDAWQVTALALAVRQSSIIKGKPITDVISVPE